MTRKTLSTEQEITMKIWDRDVPIDLVFDSFPNQEITQNQKYAFEKFLEEKETILGEALKKLIEYVKTHYEENIEEFNPFAFLRPKALLVKRSITGRRVVGLLCSCKFDIENDIVVRIVDEEITKVGTQDIFL